MADSPSERVFDSDAFMEEFIRKRAVAPLDPGSPRLPPQERRSWWEFCLEMAEFLRGIIRERMVTRDEAQQLSRILWIVTKGTYVFATPDPTLRAEQRRFVGVCVIALGALFPWIVDPDGIFEDADGLAAWDVVFGLSAPANRASEALALMTNWRPWEKNWEHARSPIAWVRTVAKYIDTGDKQGGSIPVSDALYRTPEKRRDHTDASLSFDYHEQARDLISLEQVGDIDGAAQLALPSRTWMSVAELEAAVQDDEDLTQYLQLRLQGWRPRPAWEHLGWDQKRGLAVDRRFRRLRKKIKDTGFEYQAREVELPCGVTDANCTVVKERLRFAVNPASEGTLSGRVVYDPRVGGERFDRNH